MLEGLVEIGSVQVPLRAEAWLVAHVASRDLPRVLATWNFIIEAFEEMTTKRTCE